MSHKPDRAWDCICTTFGMNPQTPSERSRVGKLARDLRTKGATPRGLWARLAAHRRKWPQVDPVTPESVLKHWDQLSGPPPKTGYPRLVVPFDLPPQRNGTVVVPGYDGFQYDSASSR